MNSAYRWGDVITLDFPYSNLAGSKLRPAVIISRKDALTPYDDFLLLALTTRLQELPENYRLEQWQAAGLAYPSSLKPNIITVESYLIVKKIGSLSGNDRDRLKHLLASITME